MEKQVIITTGDKGGIGKSTVTSLLAEYCLSQELPAVLIEGDPKIMDVAPRYKGHMRALAVDLAAGDQVAENRMINLGDAFEGFGDEVSTVLVNAPAGLSAALDSAAPVLVELFAALGYSLTTVWVAGPDEASARLAGESQLLALADRKIIAINNPAGRGDPAGTAWMRGGYSERWLESGSAEVVIPALTPAVMDAVRGIFGATLAEIRDGSSEPRLSIVMRQYLAQYLRTAEPVSAEIIGY